MIFCWLIHRRHVANSKMKEWKTAGFTCWRVYSGFDANFLTFDYDSIYKHEHHAFCFT